MKDRIAKACAKAKREPKEVTLIAVTKTAAPEQIREMLQLGVGDLVDLPALAVLLAGPYWVMRKFDLNFDKNPALVAYLLSLRTDVPLAESGRLWTGIQDSYVVASGLGWLSGPLRPVSGNRFTPTLVYVPAEDRALGQAPETTPSAPGATASVGASTRSRSEAPRPSAGEGPIGSRAP